MDTPQAKILNFVTKRPCNQQSHSFDRSTSINSRKTTTSPELIVAFVREPDGSSRSYQRVFQKLLVTIQVLLGSTFPVRCVSFDTVCCVPIGLVPKTAEAAVTGSRQGRDFVSGMIDDLESWAHRVSALTAALADRDAVIAVQAARIAELERRLGLDSSNRSKPPSCDGLTKPTAEMLRQRSRRRASDRKPGGQRGHTGGTLRRSEHPDRIADHYPATCTGCGAALDLATVHTCIGDFIPVVFRRWHRAPGWPS